MNKQFMQRAIDLSIENVKSGKGGPFGVVIAKDNKIIAEGTNLVTANNDPTAHAEIVAIRKACKKLNHFLLEGCQFYSSCEPCPMCLGAIYWAHIQDLYFGNTREDAAKINFDDLFLYEEMLLEHCDRKIPTKRLLAEKAITAFHLWEAKEDKIDY